MRFPARACIPAAFLAIALTPITTSYAAKLTPSQFKTGLKQKVGTKKGPKAYNACAKYFQKALKDKKNKKYADKYAKLCVKALKSTKVVKIALQGRAVNTLVKALLGGYFRGKKFNLADSRYNKALRVILRYPKLSQKTAINSQAIYNTIKTYATRKGVPQNTIWTYYMGVALNNRYPDPPLS